LEDNNKDIWDFIDGNDNDRDGLDGGNNNFEVFLAGKTKKDYLRELREICNKKSVEILSNSYKDARSPLRLKCRICGYTWSVKPKKIKDTYDPWGGCPECRENRRKKKSYEKYSRIDESRNIKILTKLSEYVNAKTPINLRCKGCRHEWSVRPENMIGYANKPWGGCPSCRQREKYLDESINERERALKILKKIAKEKNIDILSDEYLNAWTALELRCNECGHDWEAVPANNMMKDNWEGCLICKERKILYKNMVLFKKIASTNNCKIVSNFDDWDTEIEFRCNRCNYCWLISPHSVKYYLEREGEFCPNCRENMHKSKMFSKYRKIGDRKYALLLSNEDDYQNNTTELVWQCKICNQYFDKSFKNLRKIIGLACPDCNGKINDYIRERFCKRMLEEILNVKFTRHKKFPWLISIKGYPLHLDGYNDSLNLAFEHNGIQHYEYIPFFHSSLRDFEMLKINDKLKIEKCNLHEKKLIVIPYWIRFSEMENYLKGRLEELGIPYTKLPINWKNIIKYVRLNAYKSSNKICDILSYF